VEIRALGIDGAWVCTPRVFPDARGAFLEWFRADLLAESTGRRVDTTQANHSMSRRGTLRGVHFADVPPGQAKYVYCLRGAVLDVIVDLRRGSPTFGRHEPVRLDDVDRRAVFIGEGLGHAFCVLSETADVTYLVSTAYNPTAEHGVHPLDPDLALPWSEVLDGVEPVLSPKDAGAPSFAEAQHNGLLPSYDDCRAHYATLAP
jgi:dTDP-4-dehydrorhamnose 3,5-epimerase